MIKWGDCVEGYNRYDKYKKARNTAWNALIDGGISKLPVNLKNVAGAYGISVYSYKTAVKSGLLTLEEAVGDSFSKVAGRSKYIFVSNVKSSNEVRFDIACEMGHYLLGHKIHGKPKISNKFSRSDYEAYIFARDLLMPAAVLYGMGIHSAEKISSLCGVSLELAEKRALRMDELYKRNKFNTHPAEIKVTEQFEKFISEYGI